MQQAPAGFQARVRKIRRKAREKFFRLPTLFFSLPTLPYVTVAHPAHRTQADLREKASLATNQEGPLPSPPLLLQDQLWRQISSVKQRIQQALTETYNFQRFI